MARRKNQSMCEKTTLIAVNVIKASSLVLAEMTLGLLRHAPARKEVAAAAPPQQQLQQQGMRLVEHDSHSTGYLMAPEEGGGGGVDGMAMAYIKKVHAKNRADGTSARSAASELIPPPPAGKWARYYHAR